MKRAIDGWHHQQPDAKVLKAAIPSRAWERETKWEWSNGAFHKVDRSRLQVHLMVAHNEKLAIVRPLNLWMDHLKGDQVIAVPLDSIDDKVMPQRYVKLSLIE